MKGMNRSETTSLGIKYCVKNIMTSRRGPAEHINPPIINLFLTFLRRIASESAIDSLSSVMKPTRKYPMLWKKIRVSNKQKDLKSVFWYFYQILGINRFVRSIYDRYSSPNSDFSISSSICIRLLNTRKYDRKTRNPLAYARNDRQRPILPTNAPE